MVSNRAGELPATPPAAVMAAPTTTSAAAPSATTPAVRGFKGCLLEGGHKLPAGFC